ncbi:MAG TPA: sugar kinase [Candidatus Stackebrandtia faecavium]|nr:sugar kinase [Candidatus Stackebrandtia faecavium]
MSAASDKSGRLLVLGDVVTDVVANPHGPIAHGTDTSATIQLRPGGSGANTASWAAHCGASVTMLARAGLDTHAWHADELRCHGVDAQLRVDAERATAVVLALIADDGERSMITDRGAGAHLSCDDWDDALLDGTAHVHVSGYTLFSASGRALAAAVFDSAEARGVSTSVDPASTSFLLDFGVENFLRETSTVDIVVPNRDEAMLLSGQRDEAAAARLLSEHYPIAAVTVGERGAIAAAGGDLLAEAAAPVRAVTDSVGAGDAFTGAFLASWMRDKDVSRALRFGCETAAEAVTVVGGRPPHRTR